MIRVNLVGWSAEVDGRRVHLTPGEFNLLVALEGHNGPVKREELMENQRVLQLHLNALRGKLGRFYQVPRLGEVIVTRPIVVNREVL